MKDVSPFFVQIVLCSESDLLILATVGHFFPISCSLVSLHLRYSLSQARKIIPSSTGDSTVEGVMNTMIIEGVMNTKIIDLNQFSSFF